MKPDDNDTTPRPPADADEARVLAVLLGEASPFERETVDALLACRPDLRAYRDRAAALLAILRDAAKPDETPPARLDDARRAALLARLRTPTFRDRALDNIVAFSRPVRANAGKIAAVLALLFVVSGLLSSSVVLSKKAKRVEARTPAPEVFATGAGGGREGEKNEYAFRNLDKAKDSTVHQGAGKYRWKSDSPDAGRASAVVVEQAISSRRAAAVSDGSGTGVRTGSLFERDGKNNADRIAAAISPRKPAAPAAAVSGGSGGGEGTGLGIGRGGDRMTSEFRDRMEGRGLLEGKAEAVHAGDVTVAAGVALGAVSAKDKVPAAGEIPMIGKLFSRGAATANVDANDAFAEGLTSGGVSKGEPELVTRTANADPDSKHSWRRRLADVNEKWANPESFDKNTVDGKPAETRDAMDFQADSPAKKEKAEIADPLVEKLAIQLDQMRRDNAPPEEIAKAQIRYVEAEVRAKSIRSIDVPAKLTNITKNVEAPPPVAETRTADNAFSTFSLNVGDVSFRLAAQAVRRGALPEASGVRVEEFVNSQRYRDPEPRAPEAVSLVGETARDPFAHNRTLLRLSLRTGAEGRAAGTPLNLVALLDDSGSMERADRREAVNAALGALADNLRPGDRVSVVGFSRDTRLLIDRMDGGNPAPLRELAKNGVPSEGGTNLDNALRVAYTQLASQSAPGASGRVLLLTDGAANLGDADPERLAAVVESNRARGRAIDCFGVGFDGYNDNLLERLSRKGGGRYAYLDDAAGARAELGEKLAGALRPFAADVKVQVEFNPDRVSAWRLLGYDNHRLRKQDFRDNSVAAASLAAAESGTALYSLELKPDGSGDIGTVRVRYRIPDTQEYRERAWPIVADAVPAFDDAPEGVRTAACAAFVAACFANSPDAAVIDRAALRKEVVRLSVAHPGDPDLAALRDMAGRLPNPPVR